MDNYETFYDEMVTIENTFLSILSFHFLKIKTREKMNYAKPSQVKLKLQKPPWQLRKKSYEKASTRLPDSWISYILQSVRLCLVHGKY